MSRSTARNGSSVRGKGTLMARVELALVWRSERKAARRAAIAEGWAEVAEAAAAEAAAAAKAAEVASLAEALAAEIWAAAMAEAEVPTARTVWFTTATGEVVALAAGVRVVVGWAGEEGVRGSTATHRTEVVAALSADGTAVILTGGKYKRGATERVLPLYTAKGTPSRQIRGVLA